MTTYEAEFIKNLRHSKPPKSWDEISKIYIDTFGGSETMYGDESYGKDLCKEAANVLGEKDWK